MSISRKNNRNQVRDIVWTRTSAELRIDTAEHYCADVRDWAIAVLADTEALVKALGRGT
jgi:hypothetical protein